MTYQSVLDFVDNDLTSVYLVTPYGEWPAQAYHCENLKSNTLFLSLPQLSYGDYDRSTQYERSNVRIFKQRFDQVPGWQVRTYADHGEAIFVDLTCTDPDIINSLITLTEYPVLDESDSSLMAYELEQEAWESYLRSEFISGVEKKFKADYSDVSDEDALRVFQELKTTSNRDVEITSGGHAHIDLHFLLNYLDVPPPCFHLEWW